MTAIDIAVLGELAVARDGVPLDVPGPGRRSLLALLASRPGRTVPVDRIIDALWGEEPPASAVKVIQNHISQLRRVIEPEADGRWSLLVTHPSGYELAVPPGSVDAARFEAAVRAAERLPPGEAVTPLRSALSEWRGPPYADIDLPFARAERVRLEELRVAATLRCLEGELAEGRHVAVEPELRSLVLERPLDERAAELLMLALYGAGRQAEALQVHTDLRRALREELGVDPGPSIDQLHQRILRHEVVEPRALPVQSATPSTEHDDGNLPPERTSFVGRAEEVAEVAGMVAEHRLTTLVGAGGAGKTRLALQAARRAAAGFDGTWLVALGTLDDPDHIDGHCLAELSITDQMDRTPAETLRAWIGERRLLLVLDNCEHLVDGVANLTDDLLAACPRLHVLATSRQPLRCPGERLWRVPTLELPGAADPASVRRSEAGGLFLDRATEAAPDFVLDEETAAAIAQICRRLDGIPLAIELAAVRMGAMSASDLAAGLDHRFRLLTSGNRTALPRHRTLLAATDWSYGLLSADQQRLLCRLSVFVADFDVAAAAEVCGAPPLSTPAVPGLLADLVDQSLVEVHGGQQGQRYRLLETVREYGRDRLGEETDELSNRYGDWAAQLSEAVGSHAQTDTVTWYGRLEREFRHLQAAFGAAVRRGDAELALRIAAGSGWAAIIIGRFHRLREWLREALELAAGQRIDDRVMAQGLLMAGAVAGIDLRFEGTLDLLDQAEARFRSVGDLEGALWSRYWRAATLAEMGDLTDALAEIAAACDAAKGAGLTVVEANALAEHAELVLAVSVARGGPEADDVTHARQLLQRAQELGRANHMQELLARVGLGDALLGALAGDPGDDALSRAVEQLEQWRQLGRGNRLILGLIATAKVALGAGRPAEAWPLAEEAMRLIGEFAWSAPLHGALEVLVRLLGPSDPEVAATFLGAADVRPPTHRWRLPADLDEVRSRLRGSLGDDTFGARHAEGTRLTLDDLVAMAAECLAGRPAPSS